MVRFLPPRDWSMPYWLKDEAEHYLWFDFVGNDARIIPSSLPTSGHRFNRSVRHLPPIRAEVMVKMGRYMEITRPPMPKPKTTMIMGSMAAVRFSTAVSTSSS